MMQYEEFVSLAMKEAEDYMAVSHDEFEVKRRMCTIQGKEEDMLLLENKFDKKMGVPGFDLRQLYEEYCQMGNDNSLIIKLLACTDEAIKEVKESSNEYVVLEGVNDKIVYELVNKANNAEKLMHIPHRDFHDMAIIYRLVVGSTEEFIAGMTITNELAEKFGLDEEALYQCAVTNTKNLFPTIVTPMEEVVEKLREEAQEEIPEEEMVSESEKINMYILTNKLRIHGAIGMLDKETLGRLADELEDDLYLLPSSVHENIAVPASSIDLEFLQALVKEVNQNEKVITQEEILSNTVFYFDKQTMELLPMNEPEERFDMDESDDVIGMTM